MPWPASRTGDRETFGARGLCPANQPAVDGTRAETVREPRPLIELTGVAKVFDEAADPRAAAIGELSLSLAAGSATLVTGPSGSGKTTLLGLIGCMVRPTAGRIRVGELEITRLPEERLASLRRRWFGFVFQNHHLIRGATALQNVMLPGLPCPELNGDLRHNAKALLERFGLADRGHRRVERLSGGEQQRVAIARALINDPRVVLADEPTAHLDSGAAHGLLDLIAELQAKGKTVVVASHDPVLCESPLFSQRLELRGGRLG